MKPLALASGHSRYITVTAHLNILHSRHKFVTVSEAKRLRNGRFNSKTAVRWFQKRNGHLDTEARSG